MTYFFSKPRNVFIFSSFLFFSILLNACGGGSPGSSTATGEKAAYQRALAEYNNNNYVIANNLFNTQLDSYPTGKYADNAHYYIGRIFYRNVDYVAAQAQFDIVLQQFTNSNYSDSAQYWLAKTWHARKQFDIAIIEYNKVNSTGKWGDNAAFQLGKIDYDKAKLATTTTQAYKNYSDASVKLRAMIDNPVYVGSTSLDDAGYYLGLSHQDAGNLLLRDSTLSTTIPLQTAQDQFDLAQAEFNKITNTSIYFDDAKYQLIRITFEKAKTHADPLQSYLLFETAITNFDAFVNNANFTTGNRIDDAVYYLGRSFQEQGYLIKRDTTLVQQAILATACLTADACFIQARTNYAMIPLDSIYSDDAQYYGARSYHESGNYVMARIEYQLMIDAAKSTWADDAQYQKGKTFYDSGKFSTDPVIAIQEFTLAIAEFDKLPVLFPVGNRLDSNIYFKGRALQRQALLAQANHKLLDVIPPLDPVSLALKVDQRFIDARVVFQQLIDSDPNSKWA
ncbi:MAG: tol-pal system YbgF family protein, partial [Gammaproteobacteria bacterium]